MTLSGKIELIQMIRLRQYLLFTFLLSLVAQGKPLNQYPQSNLLWVGFTEGKITPKESIELLAKQDGEIIFDVNHSDTLTKNQIWAKTDDPKLNLKKRSLDNLIASNANELRELKWETRKNITSAKTEIENLLSEKDALEAIIHTQDLTIPLEIKQNAERTINEIIKEIEILKIKISDDYIKTQTEIKEEELNLKRENEEIGYTEFEDSLQYKAKFAGTIYFENESITKNSRVFFHSSEKIGIIQNKEELTLNITGDNQIFTGQDPKELVLKIHTGPQNGIVDAVYSGISTKNTLPTVKYSLTATKNQDLLIGTSYSCQVFRILNEKAFIVPKVTLASQLTKEIVNLGWESLIRERYPNARILAIGTREIALISE